MQTPISSCDIAARYGQIPAPQKSIAEQTGWNPDQLFRSYLMKVRSKREEDEKNAIEDALMAMVDAMNAPKDQRPSDRSLIDSLLSASEAVSEEQGGRGDPMESPEVQAIMAMIQSQQAFRQVDSILDREQEEEQIRKAQELSETEKTQAIERR